jgi:hypothetical protein
MIAPRQVRFWSRWFMLFGAGVALMSVIGPPVVLVMGNGGMWLLDTGMFAALAAVFAIGLYMLAAGFWLGRMRKWAALMALLMPTAGTTAVLLMGEASIPVYSAVIGCAATLVMAFGLIPYWSEMRWRASPTALFEGIPHNAHS